MKIDFAELPNIRDLLDRLIVDRHSLASLIDSDTAQFRVVGEGGMHAGELSRAELLTVFQSRVETGCKLLAQRYQLDFKWDAPTTTGRIDVTPAAGPATESAE